MLKFPLGGTELAFNSVQKQDKFSGGVEYSLLRDNYARDNSQRDNSRRDAIVDWQKQNWWQYWKITYLTCLSRILLINLDFLMLS